MRTQKNKGIISKLHVNVLVTGFFVLVILSLITIMIESYYFWERVAEVRRLTGAVNSFEVGRKVAEEPKIIIVSLLAISIKFSIAVWIVLRGIRQYFITNAVAFGLVSLLCANCIKAIQNVETIVNQPWRALLEVIIPLFICIVAGFGAQLNYDGKFKAPDSVIKPG